MEIAALPPNTTRRFPRYSSFSRRLLAAVGLPILLVSCSCYASYAGQPHAKKLITTGWDIPDGATFRQHIAEFEKWPFDGTAIRPTRVTAEGKTVEASFAFSRGWWAQSEFDRVIADLQAVTPHSATENFLMVHANRGDVDVFDENGWSEIVEHCRLLAYVAKHGRLKGIIFDPEGYTEPFEQFNYSKQAGHDRHTFAEYNTKTRERGRAVMRAMSREYPGITIIAYRLLSDLRNIAKTTGDRNLLLEKHGFGLLPAFLDGWLDVVPRTTTIIDGNEDSYIYNSDKEFSQTTDELKNAVQSLVDPENRPKFRHNWRIGHAIYLDAYCNTAASRWYINPLGGSRTARLEINAAAALSTTDEFVWVYGEKGRWWPPKGTYPLWPDKLADVDGALRRAKEQINHRAR